jgi:hypothetical protein
MMMMVETQVFVFDVMIPKALEVVVAIPMMVMVMLTMTDNDDYIGSVDGVKA